MLRKKVSLNAEFLHFFPLQYWPLITAALRSASRFLGLTVRAVVALRTVPVVLLLGIASSTSSAQAPVSGAEAARTIDWNAVGPGSPIPNVMPTADSDDPVEAGFAREWVERALDPARASLGGLALQIISKHRLPGDRWAYGMASALRSIIYSQKIHGLTVSRVFCNSIGCLCYVEGDLSVELVANLDRELLREMRQEFGIKGNGVDRAWSSRYLEPTWELTVVRRPNTDTSMTPPHAGPNILP